MKAPDVIAKDGLEGPMTKILKDMFLRHTTQHNVMENVFILLRLLSTSALLRWPLQLNELDSLKTSHYFKLVH